MCTVIWIVARATRHEIEFVSQDAHSDLDWRARAIKSGVLAASH